ncbi:MAG: nucleotidyl transferase AbiEii/AbiGii toxin family protein [Gemmatimonadota bacterium]|jgi:predicted nucleotidyltransferase
MTFRPSDFESLLARLTEELEAQELNFMLIGGQAVLLHGRPRLTEDIDLTLAAGPESLSRVLVACRNLRLEPLPEDVEAFVRRTFVLPAAEPETGIRVDFIFSTIPYERQAIERAVRVELKGVAVPFATAEDLILHKLFAGRARDLEDAAGVVRRQGAKLDWAYLERWAESFAEIPGREDLPDRLRKL